jgi:hypothetical protein
MTWLRVDDQVAFHEKTIAVGHRAFGALICLAAWSASQMKDGFVPAAVARGLLRVEEEDLARLVEVRFLDLAEGGYRVHDFLDYNPSRAEILAERESKRAAGQKGAAKRWADGKPIAPAMGGAMAPAIALPSPLECPRPDPDPVPTRPDPKLPPAGGGRAREGSAASPAASLALTGETPGKAKASKNGTRLPEGWRPNDAVLARFSAEGIDALASLEDFSNYWHSKAGRDATKVNWDLTFTTWVKRDIERGQAHPLELSGGEPEWQPTLPVDGVATPSQVRELLAGVKKAQSVDELLARGEEAVRG